MVQTLPQIPPGVPPSTYAYPAYAFIRRHGHDHPEAARLTQEILDALSEQTAGDTAASLRTRMLVTLIDQLHGTRHPDLTTDEALPATLPALRDADQRYERARRDADLTLQEAFDRDWAVITIEHAIAALRAEQAAARHGPLLEVLGPFVWGGTRTAPPADAAAALGFTKHAFATAVHRLRRRLREHLRRLVAATVDSPALIDQEMRHLLVAAHSGLTRINA